MSSIVSWEYYNSLFSTVNSEEFAKYEALAEKQVKLVIGPRWNSIDPNAFYYDQLRDCICNVIDKIAENERIGAGRGIASVSNDGYTENYVTQTNTQARDEMNSCIRAWLSGTGLAGAY